MRVIEVGSYPWHVLVGVDPRSGVVATTMSSLTGPVIPT